MFLLGGCLVERYLLRREEETSAPLLQIGRLFRPPVLTAPRLCRSRVNEGLPRAVSRKSQTSWNAKQVFPQKS